MLNQNCPRPEHTKSCSLLCPGVWATDPLNRNQPDIILERQESRKTYFYHLFCPCYESEFDLITLNPQEYRDWRSDFLLDIGLINLIRNSTGYVPAFGVARPQRQAEHPKSS